MHTPGRGEGALRRYRVSTPQASFFLTLCTKHRTPDLTRANVACAVRSEIDAVEADGHWISRAGVLMPDHLHLLVRLTGNLSVARCVARLKSKTSRHLRSYNLEWQTNFYEHRMRNGETVEDVVRYIFLNPYRERVVGKDAPYRWFWLGTEEAAWFIPDTDNGRPFPEWIR